MRLSQYAAFFMAGIALIPLPLRAQVDVDGKAKSVAQSIVIVDYTLKNENQAGEDSGQGIVVGKEGIILVSGGLIPENVPKEWVSEIKVRFPEKNFAPQSATFLGRTRNHQFAYLKTDEPVSAVAFEPGAMGQPKLGALVYSVARLSKVGGYDVCVGKSDIRAVLELRHTLVATAPSGLTRANSPVFDLNTGEFLGLTSTEGAVRSSLTGDDQGSSFLPGEEVKNLFTNVPTQPFDLRRAWLAVDGLTGLTEDYRSLKKIEQPAGVSVGSVIAGEAADKAGLKPRDVILTVDGKEFSKSVVPELMTVHFARALDDRVPGDHLTLGILRDGAKMDIPVTLGTLPKTGSEMPYVFSSRVGVVTRDLVFTDAYTRKLPQDTKGVYVALVKQTSAASLGTTPLQAEQIITKVDDQPVDDQKQFMDVMKKEEEKPDLKEMVFVVILRTGETQVCRIDLTK